MSELQLFAALVHGCASAGHAARIFRSDSPKLVGALYGAHALAFVFNLRRRNVEDMAAHVAAAMAARSGRPHTNAAAAVYDGLAAWEHWKTAKGIA